VTTEQLMEICKLLKTERVLALAVLVDGTPYCSFCPTLCHRTTQLCLRKRPA
jgi:hypothetical protein